MTLTIRTIKWHLSILALIISFANTYGQENMIDSWSLNDCINYAIDNNIQVNQSKLQVESAEADLEQAKGGRLPNLSGSISSSIQNERRFETDNTVADWQSNFGNSASINSGVVLYKGGSINQNIKKSELSKEIALLNVSLVEKDITLAVVQAYLNILYAFENVEYYKEVVLLSQKQFNRATSLHQAGSLSRRDVADMNAQYASDEYLLVQAENNLILRTTELKQILEIPVEVNFSIEVPDNLLYQMEPLPPIEVLFEFILLTRPEMDISNQQKRISEISIAEARSGYLPSLTLNMSAGSNYKSNVASSYNLQMSNNFAQSIGLNMTIPIFSRYENKTAVSKAIINDQIAQLTIHKTRNQLLQIAERIYDDTRAGQQRYISAMAQDKAIWESYTLATEQYNMGMINTIELLQIHNKYLNGRNELMQSKYTAILFKKILDYYMGIPVSL